MHDIKPAHLIFKILGTFAIGLSIALSFVQYNESFQHYIQNNIEEQFSTFFDCTFKCHVSDVDLASGCIILDRITTTPSDGNHSWSWTSKRGVVYFSWLTWLLTKKFALRTTFYNYEAFSTVEGKNVSLMKHLRKIFEPPDMPLPIYLKKLDIQKGVVHLVDNDRDISCNLMFNCVMQKIKDYTKATCYPTGGSFLYKGEQYATNLLGSLRFSSEHGFKVVSSLSFELPHLSEEKKCFLLGSWNDKCGLFKVHNSDRSVLIDPISINAQGIMSCALQLPWSYIHKVSTSEDSLLQNGICKAHIRGLLSDLSSKMKGTIIARDISYKSWTADRVSCSINAKQGQWGGMLDCVLTPSVEFVGNWTFNNREGASVSLLNRTELSLPFNNYVTIKPQSSAMKMHYDINGNGFLDAHCLMYDAVLDHSYTTSVRIDKNLNNLSLNGSFGNTTLNAEAQVEPSFCLTSLDCSDNNNQVVSLRCTDMESMAMEGSLDYSFLRSLLPDIIREDVAGEGLFKVRATVSDKEIAGDISLEKGIIKVPQLYNFMSDFSSRFLILPYERKALFSDVQCLFHRGKVSSKEVTTWWDKDYALSFVHAPLIVDNYFISWEKDLFGIVSGNILLTYTDTLGALLKGSLLINRSHLKGNLFSSDLQNSMLLSFSDQQQDVMLDLKILTQHPLFVSTSLWDAQAMIDVDLSGRLQSPRAAGRIDLLGGCIKFPYKPLQITGGSLQIIPQQTSNPTIELTAKNRIKKYNVTMRAYGTLLDPHVFFESNPALTEEQIIALLLAGSEEGSLNILMPTLVMQNLQYILFGPAQTQENLNEYFQGLLKPLTYIRFIPKFSDQTGRGGLRGALEIDVSDRLSGRIEKNFSLSEDWRFEVDYLLADDFSVRGIRDERGDLGGEFEMRWKF